MKLIDLVETESKKLTKYLKWLAYYEISYFNKSSGEIVSAEFAKKHGLNPTIVNGYFSTNPQNANNLTRDDYLAHKDEILSVLLKLLKYVLDKPKVSLPIKALKREIANANKLAVDWPELKAIEKSVQSL